MALTQERILTTALSLLSEYGLGDLSMRRVASELGVAPGALYYHVKNKQELLTLLAGRMLDVPRGSVAPEPASGSGATPAAHGPSGVEAETIEAVSALARGVREAIVPYPDGADVIGIAMATRPESIAAFVRIREILGAAGLAERRADWGARTVLYAVLGFVSAEHNHARLISPAGASGVGAEGGSSVAGFEAEACDFGVRSAVAGLLHTTRPAPPGALRGSHYNG
ncbi:TetR/AcrR family transcriptional regulator [Curtobacterium sp. S6]|uniref:TetR/AcrR family transcriptional regulator n=1 Tax=Curtobacterium sp. S6 TaxID=1479623 RepID=UPI000691DBCD|nr:TetR family transcriptional regulator [Curtobacterium sp. S6]